MPGPMRRQVAGIVLARGLGSGLQAVALVLLARSVTAADFGHVNAAIAVVGLVLVATGLGLSLFVPFAHAREEAGAVATALRLNTWSNLGSALVLVPALLLWAAGSGAPWGVALVGISLALERNADTLLGVPVADGDSRTSAVSLALRRLVCLAVLVPGLLLGADPVWSYGAGLVAGALAGQWHVRRAVRPRLRVGEPVPVREVLGRTWPFLVSNLTGQARTLDVSLVAAALGAPAAGLYAAGTKLVQPLLLVPQSLAAVLMPRAARLGVAEARRLGRRLTVLFLGCLVPSVPLLLRAEELVTLVMGPRYAGSGPVLGWALVALPFVGLSASLGGLLQGQGRARYVAANGVVTAVLLVPGVLAGALLGGPGGAAAGLGAVFAVRSLSLAAAVARLRPPVG